MRVIALSWCIRTAVLAPVLGAEEITQISDSGLADQVVFAVAAVDLAKISDLVDELGHERFSVREWANKRLWEIGRDALPMLKAHVDSPDPEQADRASILVAKIEMGFTPESDPKWAKEVRRYPGESKDKRSKLWLDLIDAKEFLAFLRLYGKEADLDMLEQFAEQAHDITMHVATGMLCKGSESAALEFLELAPKDPGMLMALAEFHRTHGNLGKELKKARDSQNPDTEEWLLALLCSEGDLDAMRLKARQSKRSKMEATVAAIQGDPLPWLRLVAASEPRPKRRSDDYATLAIKRWQGLPVEGQLRDHLEGFLSSEDQEIRWPARDALILLGLDELCLPSVANDSPRHAIWYYQESGQYDQALAIIGLTSKEIAQPGWVGERINDWRKEQERESEAPEPEGVEPLGQMIILAQIMEDHGMQSELVELFMPPLIKFAEQDSEEALMLIRDLLPHSSTIAREAGPGWVGNDGERWSALVDSLFGDHDVLGKCWEWMPELMPEATQRQRWDTLFCLLKREPDPDHLLDRYMSQAWELYQRSLDPRRSEILQHIYEVLIFHARVGSRCPGMGSVADNETQRAAMGKA